MPTPRNACAGRCRAPSAAAHASWPFRRALHQGHRAHVRRQVRGEVLRARRAHSAARVLRRGLQGIDRVVLDDARLPHRQVSRAGLLHHRAVRPELRRVPGLEVVRRRQQAARRDLRQARPGRHRLLLHRPRDLRLVPQGGQVGRGAEGPEDALLRPRRPGDAEARRLDAAAGGGRHLSGARARRHRRHRVLDARDGHQARLPSDRQVQLLPGLAPAGLVQRVPDEQEGVGRAARHTTRR